MEIKTIKDNTNFSKFIETLRSDLKVEVQKFGSINFDNAVDSGGKKRKIAFNSVLLNFNSIQS